MAAAAVGAVQMSARRMALTAAGVGAAAGCMGTWFEMSHGIVCIPVLALPPMQLSQQVAIGSTVFGVAARQVISATLYALEPSTNLEDFEGLSEIIDVNAAAILATTGTAAALGAASYAAKLSQRPLRKANGIFLVACALFMNWRENKTRAVKQRLEEEQEAAAELEEPVPEAAVGPWPAPGPAPPARFAAEAPQPRLPPTPLSDAPRLILLGAAAGGVLGFFGIGPAWLLAPLLHATDKRVLHQREDLGFQAPQPRTPADALGPEMTRTTACMAMVPPSIAAAWRHFQMGHVIHPTRIALPLAVGAVVGSAIGGQQLVDVPCDEDLRYGLSLLLFAHGCWSYFRP